MSDTTPDVPEVTTPSDASLAQMTPLSVSEQARIRREMRKAKVGQGADRLRKITQTQRTAAGFKEDYKQDEADLSPSPAPRAAVESTSDQEADVSEHFYKPANRARDVPNSIPPPTPPSQSEFSIDNDQIAQMMQNHPLFGASPGAPPFGAGNPQDPANDPMMLLMQQMLGAGAAGGPDAKDGGMPGGAGGAGLPPDLLSSILGAAGPGGEQQPVTESPYLKWWKVLHVLCSVLLGVYVVLSLPTRYLGTKEERVQYEDVSKIPLLWYFATMELVLQSTRYLLIERGGPPPGLIMSTIVRFLPRPLGTTLVTLSHYVKLFSIAWQDALVVIFTIGLASWVNTWFVVNDEVPLMQ